MLKKYVVEGKTEEENINKFMEENNFSSEEIIIVKQDVDSSLFKGKKITTTFTSKSDLKKFIKEYIIELGKLMNLSINVELRENEFGYNIQLICENNSILIGKDGRTISSIQTLLRQTVESQLNKNIKINIDVANYKENKLKKLEREIKHLAKEVLSSKVDVSLDPMNSYERRMIHNLIDKYDDLTTESTGEGKERHVVIKYIGK